MPATDCYGPKYGVFEEQRCSYLESFGRLVAINTVIVSSIPTSRGPPSIPPRYCLPIGTDTPMQPLKLLKTVAITGFALAVEAAFLGNIIRVRAQYAPKEENPDAEDNREVMGVSFWRMLKRVIRVEGWRGLFRGIVLLVFLALAFSALFWLIGGSWKSIHLHPVPRTIIGYVLMILFDVPFSVFFIRSITVAELLPFFNLRRGIRATLSPSERRRPWLLYLTPGLVLVFALERAWQFIVVPFLHKLISHRLPEVGIFMIINHTISSRVIAKIGLAVLDSLLLTPLQVASVRLATQRREEQAILLPDDSADIPSERVTEGEEVLATGKPPVVRLRTQTEQPAYTGLCNCIRSIVTEEGCDTIYRVWWFTFLTSLGRVLMDGRFKL